MIQLIKSSVATNNATNTVINENGTPGAYTLPAQNYCGQMLTHQGKYMLYTTGTGAANWKLYAKRMSDGVIITPPVTINIPTSDDRMVGLTSSGIRQNRSYLDTIAVASQAQVVALMWTTSASVMDSVADSSGNIKIGTWDIDANTFVFSASITAGFTSGDRVRLTVSPDGLRVAIIRNAAFTTSNMIVFAGRSAIGQIMASTRVVTGAQLVPTVSEQTVVSCDNIVTGPLGKDSFTCGWTSAGEHILPIRYTSNNNIVLILTQPTGTTTPRMVTVVTGASLTQMTTFNGVMVRVKPTCGDYVYVAMTWNGTWSGVTYTAKTMVYKVNTVTGVSVTFASDLFATPSSPVYAASLQMSNDGRYIFGTDVYSGISNTMLVYDAITGALVTTIPVRSDLDLNGCYAMVTGGMVPGTRYLVNDGGVWKKWTGTALTTVTIAGARPTSYEMVLNGAVCVGSIPSAVYAAMTSPSAYVSFYEDDNTVTPAITYTPIPKDTFFPMNQDIAINSTISNISNITVTSTISGAGSVCLVVSFDSGVTWNKWNGSTWVATVAPLTDNMTAAVCSNIPNTGWATAMTAGKIRYGVILSIAASTDAATVSSINMTYDTPDGYLDTTTVDVTTVLTGNAEYGVVFNTAGRYKIVNIK